MLLTYNEKLFLACHSSAFSPRIYSHTGADSSLHFVSFRMTATLSQHYNTVMTLIPTAAAPTIQ